MRYVHGPSESRVGHATPRRAGDIAGRAVSGEISDPASEVPEPYIPRITDLQQRWTFLVITPPSPIAVVDFSKAAATSIGAVGRTRSLGYVFNAACAVNVERTKSGGSVTDYLEVKS